MCLGHLPAHIEEMGPNADEKLRSGTAAAAV